MNKLTLLWFMPGQRLSKLQKAESSFGDADSLHSLCLKGVRCYDWAKGKSLTGRNLKGPAPKCSAAEGRRRALEGLPESSAEEACLVATSPAPAKAPLAMGQSRALPRSWSSPRRPEGSWQVPSLSPWILGRGLKIRLVLHVHQRQNQKKQSSH